MLRQRLSPVLFAVLTLLLMVSCSRADPANAGPELALLQERAAEYGGWKIAGRLSLVPDFERFTEQYWGTEEALVAQLWLLQQTANQFDTAQYRPTGRIGGKRRAELMTARVDQLMRRTLRDYIDSPLLADIPKLPRVFTNEQHEHYLNRLIQESPHREVQAACIFALADVAQNRNTEEDSERAEALLRKLITEYSDVPWGDRTYGELAAARLKPPTIGEPAMEITGFSWDGTPMRLSDYRGKVVVLDFWGDW